MIIVKKIRWFSFAMLVGMAVFSKSVFGQVQPPEEPAPALAAESASAEKEMAVLSVEAKGPWKPEALPADKKVGTWTMAGDGSMKMQRVAVGGVNNVWAIGEMESGKDEAPIYQLGRASDQDTEKWVLKASGVDVAAASDGTVIIIKKVDGKNRLFKRKVENEVESWEAIFPDTELTRISVSSDDVMWGVLKEGDTYKAYRLEDDKFEPLKTAKGDNVTGFALFAIAENEDGEDVICALDKDGEMYRFDDELEKKVKETEQIRKSDKFKKEVKEKKAKKVKKGKKKKAKRKAQAKDKKEKKKKGKKAKKGKKKKKKKAEKAGEAQKVEEKAAGSE